MNLKVKQTLIGCRKLDILMGLLIQRLQKERKNNQEETEDGQVKRCSLWHDDVQETSILPIISIFIATTNEPTVQEEASHHIIT